MDLPQTRGLSCFDKLSTNGFFLTRELCPFALSLSKGERMGKGKCKPL
jgi:hypothetical protein